jgi:hypothetical protein
MRLSTLTLVAVVVVGCSHPVVLKPASSAQAVAGQRDTAVAEDHGVRLTATGRWQGDPSDLWRTVTPVRVTIENNSGEPLRIRYSDFALTSAQGMAATAMPAFQVHKPGVVKPYFPMSGFSIATSFAPFYPDFPMWTGAFETDPTSYPEAYAWEKSLPTSDMLSKSMPVGVLANGGSVTGYMFFPKVTGNDGALNLTATLVNANTKAPVARISIPFVVVRD